MYIGYIIYRYMHIYIYIYCVYTRMYDVHVYGLRAKRAVKGFSLQEVEIVFFLF